jgi:hypothetical protein
MAVRIPIITVFDSKGLKQAEYQLNKVRGNFQNLGRNAAIAGAAIGVVTVALTKAVTAASNLEAEFEGVNQVFGSAAGSVQEFAKQASASAGLTETAALQASKVFGLFATGAGLSEKEAAKFSTTMVQLAGDLGSFNDVPTEQALAAIQSGLQGQSEPLRQFGVFLDDARLKAEALNLGIYNGKGPLTQQQKMMAAYESILKQTNIQQGDFVKYADTYGNQLKTLQSEFSNLSAEVGQQLLPVMAQVIPVIREAVAELGPKLKAALAQVDFAALATTFGQLLTFLVQNLDVIIRVASAMFILNTAYNASRVAIGLFNAVIVISNAFIAATTTTATVATGALAILRTALLFSGIGAGIIVLGLVADALFNISGNARKAGDSVNIYRDSITGLPTTTSGYIEQEVTQVDGIKNAWKNADAAAKDYNKAVAEIDLTKIPRTAAGSRPLRGGQAEGIFALQDLAQGINPDPTKGGTSSGTTGTTFAGALRKSELEQIRLGKLTAKGLTEGAAEFSLATVDNKREFTKLITNLSKAGVVDKRQAQFNRTAAGKAELAQIKADGEARNAQIKADQDEADRLRDQRLAAEKAAADERERIYKSFADSVTSTFSSIKDSIVGAFSLPELGGSTDSIIRNMDKLLTRVKSFSQNVTRLSAMGLDPSLLQQVIQAGPVAGARLAAGLVAGGADALGRINAGFGEIQTLGSEIGMTGTNSRFNNQAQQNIYNINVEGGVGSGATIGKAIVDAIKAYERTSGAVWQGA